MRPLVVAADVGTTNIKAGILDEGGGIAGLASVEAPPVEAGSGAFDAEATLEGLLEAMSRAAAHAAGAVEAIALSSQRASLVVVGEGGLARRPALSWQGTTCEDAASRFFDRVGRARFREVTGLLPNTICSVAKLARLAEEDRASIEAPARIALLHDYLLPASAGAT